MLPIENRFANFLLDSRCSCMFCTPAMFELCVAAARCNGTSKMSGKRCSITSTSRMRDASGRLVAEPLVRGGAFCRYHTVLFCSQPASIGRDFILAFVDLETDSLLDVATESLLG